MELSNMRVIRSLIPTRPGLTARTVLAACLAPLALSACGEEAGGFNLKLVRSACLIQDADGKVRPHDSSLDYFPQTGRVEVTVTEGNVVVTSASGAVTNRGLDMADIPTGKNLVATVKASLNGSVVSIGKSEPFDVVKGETTDVSVIMRWTNQLAPAADKSNHCVAMEEARVGHTAVKMRDGRVLLVGGHTGGGTQAGTGEEFLASAEIFDPVSDSFYPVARPCEGDKCFQAARAPAVALPDGRVLIVGGEAPQAIKTAAIYDPNNDRWSIREMHTARRGHSASLLGSRVIVVGGIDETGKILDTVEFFDPRDNSFTMGDASTRVKNAGGSPGRAFHSAVSRDANTLLIAGGINGDHQVVGDVGVYLSNSQNVVTVGSVVGDNKLFVPVARASATMINRKMVVVGGAGQINGEDGVSNLSRSVQWLDHAHQGSKATNTADKAEIASVDSCVVALDGTRALVLGGLNQAGAGQPHIHTLAWKEETAKVEIESLNPVPRDPPTGQVTCTDLGDGRVLVTGGVKGKEATNRAEIYTIQPLK